jgi:hypothetical protein
MIEKTVANRILSNLDATATRIEAAAQAGRIDPRVAASLAKEIDAFSDRVHVAAFGEESLRRHQAKVLKRDPDESFMDAFENPNAPIKTDPDEEFMHKVGPSFNSKGIGTYDVDGSSAVSNRDEYNVRDLNEYADGTKKQPSWAKGPAGKSTRQGAARQASTAAPKPAAPKTWSP